MEVNADCGAPSKYALIIAALPTLIMAPMASASMSDRELSANDLSAEVMR